MKRNDEKNWQLASAYIDNQLSPEEREKFEARLLKEPKLAETLDEVQFVSMSLRRLRGEKKKIAAAFPKTGMRKYLIGGALAASLMAAVVYSAIFPHPRIPNPLNVHQEFVSQDLTFQSMSNLQHASYSSGLFPDLSAGNFTLMWKRDVQYGVAAHYAGRRNCRLTLIIGQNIPSVNNSEMQNASWKSENQEYVLVSDGMDPERFQLIGDYLRKTDTHNPPISRLTLRKKIRNTKSCS